MKHNSELDQQVMELQGELGRLVEELKEEESDQIEVNGLNSEVYVACSLHLPIRD